MKAQAFLAGFFGVIEVFFGSGVIEKFMIMHDLIGGIGVFLIVGSYLALQLEKLHSTDRFYSALNALGASLVLISLTFDFNFSAALIEGFWLMISLFGLLRPRKPEPMSVA